MFLLLKLRSLGESAAFPPQQKRATAYATWSGFLMYTRKGGESK